jgi:hypothetical protein
VIDFKSSTGKDIISFEVEVRMFVQLVDFIKGTYSFKTSDFMIALLGSYRYFVAGCKMLFPRYHSRRTQILPDFLALG